MAINTGKVNTGGLLAGLVMNVLDMTFNFTVLLEDSKAMAERLHLDPAVATDFSYAIPFIVIDFILGLVIVWNYAAIRPRFGPGAKTAVLAGLVPWVSVTAVLHGFAGLGIFSAMFIAKSSFFALISVIAGSLSGGWAYKE